MRAVITFHAIGQDASPLSYPAAALDAMLTAFRHSGLPVMTLDDLLAPGVTRGVALTFDDGMASLHDDALPILRRHEAPAHLFLTTGAVGGDNHWYGQPAGAPRYPMLTWGQLEALHAGGVRIEGHTASHPDLRRLTPDQMDAEMGAADTLIEQRLGRLPAYFAYPYGYHDAGVRAVAKRRYAASFTTELAVLGAEPPERLPRLDSHYLRSPALLKAIEGAPVGLYFRLRYLLRALRGTQ